MPRLFLVLCLVSAATAFTFLSIGDWGDTEAKKTAPAMSNYSPEFILGLGDNFYNDGIGSQGTSDPQFKNKFEDTFSSEATNVPWYIVAGNHDYYGGTSGVDAEIAYSKVSPSKRWNFPSYYYSKDLTASDGTTITLVGIDTWRINGGDTLAKFDLATNKVYIRNRTHLDFLLQTGEIEKRTHEIMSQYEEEDPINPLQASGDQEQLAWLDKTLGASTADWKIVMGHFPAHSATTGEHGDTPSVIKYVQPLLEKHSVDMYFNGHDHVLQDIEINGVRYFTSGAGAREHSGINEGYEGLQGYHQGSYGFMYHEGNASYLTTTFVLADGSTPYKCTINHN